MTLSSSWPSRNLSGWFGRRQSAPDPCSKLFPNHWNVPLSQLLIRKWIPAHTLLHFSLCRGRYLLSFLHSRNTDASHKGHLVTVSPTWTEILFYSFLVSGESEFKRSRSDPLNRGKFLVQSGATSKDLVPLITLYVRMVLAADPFSHLKMQEPNCGFCIVSSIKCRGGVVADLVFPVGLAAQIHCAGLCIRYKSYCKVLDRWNNITLAYPNGHSPLSPSVDTRHSEYPPGQGRSMLTNAFPLAGRCRLFPRKH